MRTHASLAFLCGTALGLAFSVPRAPAQAAPPPAPIQSVASSAAVPAYDVATVKPNNTGSGKVDIWTHDNSYIGSNVALKALLQDAFNVQKNLILGLPPWAESARFDIDAKVTDMTLDQLRSLSVAQRQAMLRALLVDRFGLKWHRATQIFPVYNLVVDKAGPKFQHTTPEQAAAGGDGTHVRNRELGIQNVPLAEFCAVLSDRLEKPVLDKTSLTGNYTFLLHFTPDDVIARSGDQGLPVDAPPPLFTALPEQLGLRLEPGKGPVETLVIDSISPPTDN